MKRYMVYSFCTLWTLVLIVALIGAVIHQVRFQDSPGQLKLEHEIKKLELENQNLTIKLETEVKEHELYRQWLFSWR